MPSMPGSSMVTREPDMSDWRKTSTFCGSTPITCNRMRSSLQPCAIQSATACDAACNRVRRSLQPCAIQPATACDLACNRM